MAFGVAGGLLGAAGGLTTIGRGVIDIGVSSYRMRNDMRRITQGIQGESKVWGAAFRGALIGLQAVAVTVGATIFAAVGQAEKFNATMARVYALTDLGEGSTALLNSRFNELHDSLLKLGPAVATGPAKLAEALYFIASVGIREPAAAVEAVTKAAQAAASGGADIENVAKAMTALYNGYNLASSGAAGFTKVSDILTQTVIRGAAEFDEVARAIGPVGVIANTAGIKLEELGAAFATLTTRGLTARRSQQALFTLFSKLAAPTQQAKREFALLGFEYDNNVLKTKGLLGVMQMFNEQAKKNGLIVVKNKQGQIDFDKTLDESSKNGNKYFDRWRKLTGTQNAMLASIIMVGDGAKDYKANLDAMNRSMGITTEAFEAAKKKDFGLIWQSALAGVQSALVIMGEKFLPTLREVVSWLGDRIPGAINYLSTILFNKIGPALAPMLKSLGDLAGTFISIFSGKTVSGGEALKGAVDGIVDGMISLMDSTKKVADFLRQMFQNDTVRGITLWAGRLAGIALSFKIIQGAIRSFGGKLGSLFGPMGGALTGKGAGGGLSGNVMGSAALKLEAAGLELSLAARELLLAAQMLLRASGLGGGQQFWTRGPGGRFQSGGTLGAVGAGGASAGSGTQAIGQAASAAGQDAVNVAGTGFLGGIKSGFSKLKSGFSKVIGGLSKLVWPLMIAEIGTEFIKAPLGDFIAKNTTFKHAGERMKDDFWGGLIDVAADIFSGGKTDIISGLKDKIDVGHGVLISAAGVVTNEIQRGLYMAVQNDLENGVTGTQLLSDQIALSSSVQDSIGKLNTETMSEYAKRLIAQANSLGLDVGSVMEKTGAGRGQKINITTDKAKLDALAAQIAQHTKTDVIDPLNKQLRSLIIGELSALGYDAASLNVALSTSDLKALDSLAKNITGAAGQALMDAIIQQRIDAYKLDQKSLCTAEYEKQEKVKDNKREEKKRIEKNRTESNNK